MSARSLAPSSRAVEVTRPCRDIAQRHGRGPHVRASVIALALALTPALRAGATAGAQSTSSAPFPQPWLGEWSGTLTTVGAPDIVRNRIPITLRIAREDTGSALTWRTIFNADTTRGLRDYRLVVRDAARGRYATDEGNGLLLEETYLGGTLVSVFQVGGRVLESRYTLRGDTLTHDITWWSAVPATTMRGEGANGERGAEVRSFVVDGRQQAVMTRRAPPRR